jgi:hypothetical protein
MSIRGLEVFLADCTPLQQAPRRGSKVDAQSTHSKLVNDGVAFPDKREDAMSADIGIVFQLVGQSGCHTETHALLSSRPLTMVLYTREDHLLRVDGSNLN